MSWQSLTTRGRQRPTFLGKRPVVRKTIMPRTAKDDQQDKQIKSIKRSVRKIENAEELKHVDTMNGLEMVADPGTAQTLLLNGLMQGDTDTSREGRMVKYTSIQFKGDIESIATSVDTSKWRFIVFWDKQANGIAPTAAMLLDLTTITPVIYAPYNQKNYTRFKIVHDQRGSISPILVVTTTAGTTTAVGPMSRVITFRKRLTRQANYGLGNAGTIADISINSLYILALSDSSDASNLGPVINFGIRLNYKDD